MQPVINPADPCDLHVRKYLDIQRIAIIQNLCPFRGNKGSLLYIPFTDPFRSGDAFRSPAVLLRKFRDIHPAMLQDVQAIQLQ